MKGRSGNPRGRPRKPKPRPLELSDVPSNRLFGDEIYRLIPLRENGQAIELPAAQAPVRAVVTGAIKGNRFLQKYLMEHLAQMETIHL